MATVGGGTPGDGVVSISDLQGAHAACWWDRECMHTRYFQALRYLMSNNFEVFLSMDTLSGVGIPDRLVGKTDIQVAIANLAATLVALCGAGSLPSYWGGDIPGIYYPEIVTFGS